MKNKNLLKVLMIGCCVISLVGCGDTTQSNNSDSTQNQPSNSEVQSQYKIKITAIGSTTILTSKTLSLRVAVSGTTKKDVTWTSGDESIATVNDKGVVTGISAGKVKITATLDLDPNCKESIEITVEQAAKPTEVNILNEFVNNVGWVGESIQLNSKVEPSTASSLVAWSSSNTEVATVTETGYLTFLKEGNVTISATSKDDTSVVGSLTLTVKQGVFYTNLGSASWNYSHQADENNAYIDIDASNDDNSAGLHSAFFATTASTKFYSEATFKAIKLTSDTWNWQGFGLGTGLSNNDLRIFSYSPHSPVELNNNHNKIVLRDIPEQWGTGITNRSQVWGEHDLNRFELTDEIKIGMLRNGNEYYYLIDDEVYWYDNTDKYDGVATKPMLFTYDLPVKVSDYKVITDSSKIDELLTGSEYKKSFYAAYKNVNYESDSKFILKDTETLSKDHKVRSIGDKAKVVKNFEIEFDVEKMAFNSEKSCHTGLTINLSRYDNADIVDTISIGRSVQQENGNAIIGRFTKWDYPTNMENPNSIKDWFETTSTVKESASAKSHVKIIREIDSDKEIAKFRLFVDGVEYTFDLGKKGTVEGATSTYTGAYIIWVAGEYSSCEISNFVFRSDVNFGGE